MASTEITLIDTQLQQELPGDYRDWETELKPLHEPSSASFAAPC